MEFTNSKIGNFLVLAVKGRMDALSAQQFEDEFARRLAAGEKRFVVDLSGLDYISSAGLRSILTASKRLKAENGDLAFCGLTGIVAQVFTVSGFLKILPVFATREEALTRS
jgi:anti-anti-sigma factor